jgi:exodeoxyribonuclease III
VNGIRARYNSVMDLISQYHPDIITIQEAKASFTKDKPNNEITDIVNILDSIGYGTILHSTNGHHGIMTLVSYESMSYGKIIELVTNRIQKIDMIDFTLYNVYIEQGQSLDSLERMSEKYRQLNVLYNDVVNELSLGKKIIIAGDFNICPEDYHVWSTSHWAIDSQVGRGSEEIRLFNRFIDLGFTNVEPSNLDMNMTWYSYRHTWRKWDGKDLRRNNNYGIKCDHILLSDKFNLDKVDMYVDNEERFRFPNYSTSDHVPMLLSMELL